MTDFDKRFSRLELALGPDVLSKFQSSHVSVMGIGGVGCIAAEMLVRSGIGTLDIIDIDSYQSTDINRQIFAAESTLGKPKVQAAEERLKDINPDLKINAFHMFFHTDTATQLLTPAPDFVVDAIDAVLPKVELLTYCHKHNIPVISVMGAAVRKDYSKIQVADIKKTAGCPLARVIRKRLRKRQINKGIPCVFSTEPGPPLIQPDEEIDDELKTGHFRGRPRAVIGSYGPLINIFGILAADYVLQNLEENVIKPDFKSD